MNDRDFMRYSRQILLEDIAIDGQQKLLASRVLIVGLGGLGAPAALYLATCNGKSSSQLKMSTSLKRRSPGSGLTSLIRISN